MKFAISLFQSRTAGQPERTIYSEAIEQVCLAEALGFHAAWFTEQHFNDFGTCPDPLTFAAHAAAVTRTIRLGTGVVVLSLHHPIEIAERAALVDQLSEGRLDLGIGKGHPALNYGAFGLDSGEDEARFFEAHDVLERAWSGEEVVYEGKFFGVTPARIVPGPYQDPHPPVWVATFGNPAIISFAARHGYPLLNTFSPKVMREYHELYRSEYAGASPPITTVARAVHVHADGERARREMVAPARWYLDTNPGRRGPILSYELAIADYFDKLGLIGSVGECIEQIEALRAEHDVDYLVCVFGLGGLPHEQVMAAMRLFAADVMPHFADEPHSAVTRSRAEPRSISQTGGAS